VRAAAALLTLTLLAAALIACESESSVLSSQAIVSDIPWADMETAHYRIMDGDDEIGTGELSIEVSNSTTTFRQAFENEEFRDETTAVADSQTLAPLSVERLIEGPEGPRHWQVEYEGTKASVRQESDDGERDDEVTAPSNSYDSWTDLFLWRTIAFKEGFEATYADVLSATLTKPQVISQKLRVEKKETVEVPAGTYEAWKLRVDSPDGKQTAWYADTPERPLVKYDNGEQVFELKSID
jgi:hypothetical protein